MINRELAAKVRQQIEEHPETHRQEVMAVRYPDCRTAMCAAGWAVALSDPEAQFLWHKSTPSEYGYSSTAWYVLVDGQREEIWDRAAALLGLDGDLGEDDALFRGSNGREEVLGMLALMEQGRSPRDYGRKDA